MLHHGWPHAFYQHFLANAALKHWFVSSFVFDQSASIFACNQAGATGFQTVAHGMFLLPACDELTLMSRLLQIVGHVFPSSVCHPVACMFSLSNGTALPVLRRCFIPMIFFVQTFEWMAYVQSCIVSFSFKHIRMRRTLQSR